MTGMDKNYQLMCYNPLICRTMKCWDKLGQNVVQWEWKKSNGRRPIYLRQSVKKNSGWNFTIIVSNSTAAVQSLLLLLHLYMYLHVKSPKERDTFPLTTTANQFYLNHEMITRCAETKKRNQSSARTTKDWKHEETHFLCPQTEVTL